MALLCALDLKEASQFLFAYDTYAECVYRGYYQMTVVFPRP